MLIGLEEVPGYSVNIPPDEARSFACDANENTSAVIL
jgi:hypothetical protein